jgi:hypothetical protein
VPEIIRNTDGERSRTASLRRENAGLKSVQNNRTIFCGYDFTQKGINPEKTPVEKSQGTWYYYILPDR